MTPEQLATENDTTSDDMTLEGVNMMTETTGLTRQRLITFRVNNLNPKNPVVPFSPGRVALTRIDSALVIPYGAYVEAYWNKNKKEPEIIFDSYPEGKSFEFQLMVWGTQTR